jgi:hypothetical protein
MWTLVREGQRWTLHAGEPAAATTRARVSDETLWRLLHNALSLQDAASAVHLEGRRELAGPLLAARSVIV